MSKVMSILIDWYVFQDESVEEKMNALLPGDVLTGLVSSNWKERLASMEKFTEVQ